MAGKGNPNWKKGGVSPNPSGRSKDVGKYRDLILARTPEAIDAVFNALLDPKQAVAAARVIFEFGIGRVQAVELSGPDRGPIQVIDFSKWEETPK